MNTNLFVLSSVICIICSMTLYSGIQLIKNFLINKRRQYFITNFENYITVLDYHMDKAYTMIYKDRILIYSVEATKLDDNQFKEVLKDFLKLAKQFLGKTLEDELIELYGSEETFLLSMTEYFNSKFENDEIRKESVDNLMNSD